jgi:hypothetical protein
MVARNLPGVSGSTAFGATAPLWDTTLSGGPLETRSASTQRFEGQPSDPKVDYVWRQAIDFNGDGRIDIIDAHEEADHWVVYLNTPDPGSSGIKWVRRSVLISPLYRHFQDRHLVLPYPGYLPLSKRVTGHDIYKNHCWHCDHGRYSSEPDRHYCRDDDPNPIAWVGRDEQTYTEWEVKDLNGDGYPDVVFNSSPVQLVDVGPNGELNPCDSNDDFYVGGEETYLLLPADSQNKVEAVLNVRGLFITDDAHAPAYYPFSSPVTLTANTSCGVGKWMQEPELYELQSIRCDLVDVNGDGLLDRVEDRTVFLGTGIGFDTAPITLPGRLAVQSSGQLNFCGHPTNTFTAQQIAGLRDLTGDGIPDYVVQRHSWVWEVYVGTGTGFSTPIGIDGPFILSQQKEVCDGTASNTIGGLYDIDGDGRPETVQLRGANLDVYQLAGGTTPRTPEAGRVVRVDNGFGAATMIAYRSAKEDGTALHQVTFPEIVTTSIQTTGTLGLGGTLAETRYAYGGAELFYDPTLDAFTFPGYRRTVQLRSLGQAEPSGQSVATIIDRYALAPWSPTMTLNQRFGRYLRAGRTSDVTTLGGVGTDPWPLLSVNVTSDSRRIAGQHFEWDTRSFVEAPVTTNDLCMELMYPYDFDASVPGWFGSNAYDFCRTRGFIFGLSVDSWRGSAAPPSTNNVQTRTTVRSVDPFGQVLSVFNQNDLFRNDDDVCVDTIYATPTGQNERVLSAPASQRVWNCGPEGNHPTYAMDYWVYDNLPAGSVAAGLVTNHTIEPHAADTGASYPVIKDFDVIYNALGNPQQIVRVREDGAQRLTTIHYDPFGLAVERMVTNATNAPALEVSFSIDPVSLGVLSTKDENGTERGVIFDGFGRPVLGTIRPPGGTLGALRSLSYLGFAGGDPLGRRVVVKEFTDPIDPATVGSAIGRTSTTHRDELGRQRQTRIALGTDYGNETMISGARVYDALGRVLFEADPYPASQDPETAYGTTRYFNTDGSPRCFLRGRGLLPFSTVPDDSTERYPTCFTHSFSSHMESLSVRDAASLTPGSPQNGVVYDNITSAIGRPLFRSTSQMSGTRLEFASFTHDHLGNLNSMTRYGSTAGFTNPVQWSWRYDSLGRLLQLNEPGSTPQTRSYSNWGELLQMQWTPPAPEPAHSVIYHHDALGRLIETEEQNGGVTDPATVKKYDYDVGKSFPQVNPTYVLGRMARAAAATGEVHFSYDAFGRINAPHVHRHGREVVRRATHVSR